MPADLWDFPASARKNPGGCFLCYNAPWGSWDYQEVHKQACEDSCEARRADPWRNQAVSCQCWEGG